ncbi:DUF2235 domain-containing protein [Candidatus Bathyarchaeota archaeon]|nr:DUF2235 domain-containing protein [Candidatus Bathyarchaeota archaeon]
MAPTLHADGPHNISSETAAGSTAEPKKLILCFDGTGNEFSGSNADTNVVKILNKLDRNDPNQFHYYQSK